MLSELTNPLGSAAPTTATLGQATVQGLTIIGLGFLGRRPVTMPVAFRVQVAEAKYRGVNMKGL